MDKIQKLLDDNPEGVTQQMLAQLGDMGHFLPLLNQLLQQKKVELQALSDGSFIYKKAIQDSKFVGLSAEDMLVFQEVQEAGNRGIWSKEIKNRTNIAQTKVTRILKNLEERHIIKAVKSISGGNKKTYLLYELEPAEELSGGAWYDGEGFDAEFVEMLVKTCRKLVEQGGEQGVTLSYISAFLKEKKVVKAGLKDEDLKKLMERLMYDGDVDLIEKGSGQEGVYKLASKVKDDFC
eukprot:TRINITY_DN13342_c0_g1_i4.p1 TRINITY_DN13342_c0_g1~~TRINITY_DN13342_c0_g1_i4.p1  ORF type:complete len:236 (-),score=51.22 TRINITY_DN13342_c0_g1_i4:67-774(-)